MHRLTLLFIALAAQEAAAFDPLDYVNLFIGTVNGGHTFPGMWRVIGVRSLLKATSQAQQSRMGW